MRTLYDAVTPGNIPLDAQMVAGYVDGRYVWHAADWALFPNAVKVRIAVFPTTNDGQVLDVEQGDATPAQAPGWVVRRRAAGVDPSVYCSLSIWPAVKIAFHNAGVTEPHYWIAAYPGNGAKLYSGAVAHQYANPGPVDISVVADYWPGVDPTPVVPPGPASDIPPIVIPPAPTGRLIVRTIDLRHADTTPVRGPGVIPLQRLLGVTVDGIAGQHTKWALGKQQQLHGVAADFIFGVNTASALLAN